MTGTSTLVELLLARIEQDERIVDLSHRHPHARRYGRPPADRGRVAIHAGTLLSLSDSRTPSCRSGVKARPRGSSPVSWCQIRLLLGGGDGQAVRNSSGRAGSAWSWRMWTSLRMEMSEK